MLHSARDPTLLWTESYLASYPLRAAFPGETRKSGRSRKVVGSGFSRTGRATRAG